MTRSYDYHVIKLMCHVLTWTAAWTMMFPSGPFLQREMRAFAQDTSRLSQMLRGGFSPDFTIGRLWDYAYLTVTR